MWFYRRMLRVSYTAHETNISVLQRMGQERQLLRTIKERQTRFTGHIIRKGELDDLILSGKVQGKKARGGQWLLFLNQVMENTGLTSPRTIWDAARNRTLKIKTSLVVKGRIDQGKEERDTYLQRHWQCQASARFTLHFKDFLAYLKNGLPVQPVNLYQLVVVHEIKIIGSFMKNTWNSMPPSRQVKHRCHFCVDVGCCYTYDIVNELKALLFLVTFGHFTINIVSEKCSR